MGNLFGFPGGGLGSFRIAIGNVAANTRSRWYKNHWEHARDIL
jgi:hypothetical protein